MSRLFKCEYCEAKPTTTHGKEFLCNRHYNVLYGHISGEQIVDVPKTKKEKELYEHYMRILDKHNFVDAQKTRRIVRQFLKDVNEIKIANSIYH